jgi:hypothetical protein
MRHDRPDDGKGGGASLRTALLHDAGEAGARTSAGLSSHRMPAMRCFSRSISYRGMAGCFVEAEPTGCGGVTFMADSEA